jgi:hypothetical protein
MWGIFSILVMLRQVAGECQTTSYTFTAHPGWEPTSLNIATALPLDLTYTTIDTPDSMAITFDVESANYEAEFSFVSFGVDKSVWSLIIMEGSGEPAHIGGHSGAHALVHGFWTCLLPTMLFFQNTAAAATCPESIFLTIALPPTFNVEFDEVRLFDQFQGSVTPQCDHVTRAGTCALTCKDLVQEGYYFSEGSSDIFAVRTATCAEGWRGESQTISCNEQGLWDLAVTCEPEPPCEASATVACSGNGLMGPAGACTCKNGFYGTLHVCLACVA